MSVVLTTVDGRVKVVPKSYLGDWFFFATMTRMKSEYQLPLNEKEFEIWWDMALLMRSKSITLKKYYLRQRRLFAWAVCERVLGMMGIGNDDWKLYSLPHPALPPSRANYETIGKLMYHQNVVISTLAVKITEVYCQKPRSIDLLYVAHGVLHCNLLLRGGYIDAKGKINLHVTDVSWNLLADYGCDDLFTKDSVQRSSIFAMMAGTYRGSRMITRSNVGYHMLSSMYDDHALLPFLKRYV